MASALQKLLRRPPPARIISALHPSQSPNPIDALRREFLRPTAPLAGPATTEQSHSTVAFPSFPFGPFGFTSKPIFATGFCTPEPEGEDAGLEDSRTLWADSVKKKRKRKMNKHKYQKLRKRMRRQS